jgi:hypothetical protein
MAVVPLLAIALIQAASPDVRGTSDNVIISGPSPLVCTAAFSEQRVVVDINARGPQSVGTVSYTCNSPNGLVRRITSENGGALVLDGYRIPYLLEERGSDSLGFAFQQFVAPLVSPIVGQEAVVDGVADELRVMIPTLPRGLVAGEYSDNVTIEISPN